jgi:hypothetical protein
MIFKKYKIILGIKLVRVRKDNVSNICADYRCPYYRDEDGIQMCSGKEYQICISYTGIVGGKFTYMIENVSKT